MEPIRKMYITDGLNIEHTMDETWVTFKSQALLDEVCIKDVKKQLFDLVDQKKDLDMLLNFKEVEFMSSSFLGLLVTLDNHLRERERKLTLCNINPTIHKVFKLTRLDKVLNIV